ncbi:MAG: phage tail protein [Gammaproteobacteria bacterium]|nr:phage tail protein [Gammaproteobacteria bacterium]
MSSPVNLRITFDEAECRRGLQRLHRKVADVALVRALNKTATSVRAEAVRIIRRGRQVKAKTVREAIAVRRANKALMVAEVIVSGRPIPLRDYAARQIGRGVSVNVTGKRKVVAGAFQVQKIGNNVFIRQGKKRLPIKKLYGPSLPSVFNADAIQKAVERMALDTLRKRFNEEVRYELSKQA